MIFFLKKNSSIDTKNLECSENNMKTILKTVRRHRVLASLCMCFDPAVDDVFVQRNVFFCTAKKNILQSIHIGIYRPCT